MAFPIIVKVVGFLIKELIHAYTHENVRLLSNKAKGVVLCRITKTFMKLQSDLVPLKAPFYFSRIKMNGVMNNLTI